jgi:hypothetical protein
VIYLYLDQFSLWMKNRRRQPGATLREPGATLREPGNTREAPPPVFENTT